MMHLSQFANYIFHRNNTPNTSFKIEIRPVWDDNGVTQFKLHVSHLMSSQTGKQQKKEEEKKLSKAFGANVKIANHYASRMEAWGGTSAVVDIQRGLSEILLKNIDELMTSLDKDWPESKINIEAKFVLSFNEREKSFSFDTKNIKSATYEKASAFLDEITEHFQTFEPRIASRNAGLT